MMNGSQPTGRGEVVLNKKNKKDWLGEVEVELKKKKKKRIGGCGGLFFFFFYGAAFLGAAIDKNRWTSYSMPLYTTLQAILQILHTTDTDTHRIQSLACVS